MKSMFLVIIFILFVVSCFAQEANYLFVITSNGKKGYINQAGKIVIEPQFDDAKNFSEKFAGIQINGKWGFIDQQGIIVIAPRFTYIRSFADGLALINENGRFGYVNTKGEVSIKPEYDKAFDFSDGLARVQSENKWKFIDKRGKVVIDSDFDYVNNFHEDRAVVANSFSDGKNETKIKVAFIDKTGKLVSDWFNFASDFSEGLAFTSTDSSITAYISRYSLEFDDDIHLPKRDQVPYQVIDASGKIVFEGLFQYVTAFSDGLAGVTIDGKIGFINKQGKLIIPPQFDSFEPFSEGKAYVGVGDKRYFIDKSGKILFETEFSLLNGFRSGIAEVFSCKLLPCVRGYVNNKGVLVARDK